MKRRQRPIKRIRSTVLGLFLSTLLQGAAHSHEIRRRVALHPNAIQINPRLASKLIQRALEYGLIVPNPEGYTLTDGGAMAAQVYLRVCEAALRIAQGHQTEAA